MSLLKGTMSSLLMLAFVFTLCFPVTALADTSPTITRSASYDRYETAAEITKSGWSGSDYAVLAYGENYPDALSVGSIAGFKQMPIILVPGDAVPDSVKNYVSNVNVSKSYVIGYSDVISDQVYNEFPKAERILGEDKYARNIAVNQKFENEFKSEKICLATGEVFADALSGGAYAAKIGEPIILVNSDPPAKTKSYYQQKAAKATNVYVFGGTGIIPERVLENLNVGDSVPADSVYPTGISLNKSKLNTRVGITETLTALLEMPDAADKPVYGNNSNVTWTSSNPDIATVNDLGEVVGIKPGTVVITATAKNSGKTASCDVSVFIGMAAGDILDIQINDLKIGETEATFNFQVLINGKDVTAVSNITGEAVTHRTIPVSLNFLEKKGTIKFADPSDGERLKWINLCYVHNENAHKTGAILMTYDCQKDDQQYNQ